MKSFRLKSNSDRQKDLIDRQKIFEEKHGSRITRRNFLESKTWYRIYKILGVIVIILSFFAPMVILGASVESFFAGLLNVVIWSILYAVIQKMLLYMIYGSKLDELVKAFDLKDEQTR